MFKNITSSIVLSRSTKHVWLESLLLFFSFYFFFFFIGSYYSSVLTSNNRLIYSFFYALSLGVSYNIVTLILRSTSKDYVIVSLKVYIMYVVVLCIVSFFLCVLSYFLIHYSFNAEKIDFTNIPIDIAYLPILFLHVFEVILFYQIVFVLFNYYYDYEHVDRVEHNMDRNFDDSNTSSLPEDSYTANHFINSDVNLTIAGLNKDEVVTFSSKDFIYAKSDGHYIKVFYLLCSTNLERPMVKSILIRNSMKSMEKELLKVLNILRVHNSFFVNLKMVKYYRGNSRGGLLVLTLLNIKVPVSKRNVNRTKSILILNHPHVLIHN